ncbi:MAG: hypothetical protein JSS27_20790 [Planctomycetes bacterium]|nr:hypothetical protein [Planctomycetota bacterium]
MLSSTKRFLRMGAGVVFVVLGVIGLIVPIMPGWAFLIPGLMLLGIDPRRVKHGVDRIIAGNGWLRRIAAKLGYHPANHEHPDHSPPLTISERPQSSA